ncbi:MAG: trigger factor [Candidatus Dadabacteria bacterium]|nr:MAG: trigger factor [Candidatus Dadabacteria bacterium]
MKEEAMNYKSSIEDVNEVTKKLTVSIPADTVSREYENALSGVMKNTRIKGFRPGKAPRNIVEKLHGGRVRMEVANRLISDSLQSLLKEHEINMVGMPEIDIASYESDKDIEYTANVSIFPTPEISGYDSFELEVPEMKVKPEEVDSAIEQLRENQASTRKIEDRSQAQKGDVIEAEVTVKVDGQEQGPAEPLVVALGEGRLPEELEKAIEGLKIGESCTVSIPLPDDHQDKNLRGKTATYTVNLKGLSEKVLPEIDDAFAKNVGMNVETLLELRVKISEQLEKEKERQRKELIHEKILEQLLERNEFMVPQPLVDDEIRGLLVRYGLIDPRKVDPGRISVEPFREKLGEVALKRVKTAVLVDRIAEKENLLADQSDIEREIKEATEKHGMPEEEVRRFFMEQGRSASLLIELTRNKVLDFLSERATVKYVQDSDGNKEGKGDQEQTD